MIPFLLLVGVVVGIYVLVRMRRSAQHTDTESEISAAPASDAAGGRAGPGDETASSASQRAPVGRAELLEMIDSLIEQYEEEIREMTPAQQQDKRESWEEFERRESMTQMEFSEGVIERFWGYEPGSTPEIPNTKKLRLARGVWYTTHQAPNES